MTPTSEEWRPVPGWEGYYEVSDHGRVRSVERMVYAGQGRYRRNAAKVLAASRHSAGDDRRIVGLYRNRYVETRRIAPLVLEAFVGPRPQRYDACHNDGDATNDHLSNLRWDTRSANFYDAVRHGTHPTASRTHCPRSHVLALPNLVRCDWASGRRSCLACNRARATLQQARKTGCVLDLKSEADAHYAQIMKGAP